MRIDSNKEENSDSITRKPLLMSQTVCELSAPKIMVGPHPSVQSVLQLMLPTKTSIKCAASHLPVILVPQ